MCITLKELSNSSLRSGLTPEKRRVLFLHLLQGCETCCNAVWRSCFGQEQEPLTAEQDAAYELALDRVVDLARRADSLPPGERKQFSKAFTLLASGGGNRALTDAEMDLKGLGVYEALLARSWAVRYDNPREMYHLAKNAVEIAKDLNPLVHGASRVADYQARAWGELGNAYRAADQFQASEQAFRNAFALFEKGTGNRLLRTRLLDLRASLYGTTRALKEAHKTLKTVTALYQEAGEDQLAIRSQVKRALYTFYDGKPEEALRLNQEALDRIHPEHQFELMTAAIQNKLLFLTETGRLLEARRLLFENRPRFLHAGRVNQVKIRGIEARIYHGLEKYAVAEAIFRDVKRDFSALELRFACALMALELGLTLLCQHRIDEAEQEVFEAGTVFVSLNLEREIRSCVILLEEAFRMRAVTVEIMENAVCYIRKTATERGLW